MATFTVYDGSDITTLTDALLAPSSGIVITSGSIVLNASNSTAVNFYDGTLTSLGISAGLLLTSGTTPGLTNTVPWYGTDNSGTSGFYNGNANIDAVVNTVFQTQSYDATTLSFDFTVTDPTATSVSFDLVFGSDEYPEWVDQFVDCAVVMVNGVNYAYFNHDPNHPLSVVSSNLAAGYFQDNAGNVFPIEYDGVSYVLKIVAPIIPGTTNHIEIGIADTGDHIYDSGIFISNLSAGTIPGSGVVITPSTPCTDSSDTVMGTVQDEYVDLKGGDDTCYAGGGDDIVVGGGGNDTVYGGSGADQLKGDAGNDYLDGGSELDTAVFSGASTNYIVAAVGGGFTITDNTGSPLEGTDTLMNVEFVKFSDGLFAIGAGGVLTPVADPGTPPVNTPGSVVISGIGSVGNTLTATVSDPDGVSGSVSYQWQVSADNGASWGDVGTDSNTYTVVAGDVGMVIQVIASYTDNGSTPVLESPVSAPKTIQEINNGDLIVTLMQLDAPVGASVINPLTTLVQDAIDLGLSPNMAALIIKSVLGLPAEINLQTYDAYAVLLSDPNDATASAVEEVAVQIAILTSLSDDDTGMNLTLKILEAAAGTPPRMLDLADVDDLSWILGIPAIADPDTGKYPEPLNEILDRNLSMSDAVDDVMSGGGPVGATGLSVIEAEWQDLLSIQDGIDSTSIADLSIHVNQAPTGIATAVLASGLEDMAYNIFASDLLQGFSDADGGTLSVTGLNADNGTVTDNGDGTFTIMPNLNYVGPVELTYTVDDGQGGSATASQLFVIAPPSNVAPVSTDDSVTTLEDTTVVLALSDFGTYSDIESDPLASVKITTLESNGSLEWYNGSSWVAVTLDQVISAADINAGNLRFVPDANENGTPYATIGFKVGDGTDFSASAYTLTVGVTPVNDAPVSTDDSVTPLEDTTVVLGTGDFGSYSDTESTPLASVQITTLPTNGTLEFYNGSSWGAVALNDEISGTNIGLGNLRFVPDANENGTPYATIGFKVGDGTDFSASAYTLTVGVTPVNDAPVSTDDSVTTLEGTAVVLALSDFGTYSDTESTPLASVQITTLESNGSLEWYDGVAWLGVTLSQEISVADINAGNLRFVPDLNENGTPYATIGFKVGDGTDFSASAYTLTVDVTITPLTLTGTAGADTLTGGAGNDTLTGLAGNDTLNGGNGDDLLEGGAGKDTLNGDFGVDTVSYANSTKGVGIDLQANTASGGDAQGDHLYGIENLIGSAFSDTLVGDGGINNLSGGSGNDVLRGLGGSDTLTGGLGTDKFDFDATTDSGLGVNADLILDFVGGIDKIDLSTIDADPSVKKDQAFSGTFLDGLSTFFTAAGQLRFEYLSDTNTTVIQGNTDANLATAEFEIQLVGKFDMTAADFVL